MATVKKNVPAPVVQPPTTVDITGLTEYEFGVIREALYQLWRQGRGDSPYKENPDFQKERATAQRLFDVDTMLRSR